MQNKARKYKAGLFVVISGTLFVALLALAIGSSLWEDRVTYRIHFDETVKGMVVGSQVNFQGVNIGSVAAMRFYNGHTEVSIDVQPELAPIQDVTRASLDRAWVTGQVTVELTGWSEQGRDLAEGGVIKAALSTTAMVASSLPEVVGNLNSLLNEYRDLAANLNAFLNAENRKRMGSILASVDSGMASVNGRLPSLLAQVDEALLPNLEKGLAEFSALAPELEKGIRSYDELAQILAKLAGHPSTEGFIVAAETALGSLHAGMTRAKDLVSELTSLMRGSKREIGSAISNLAQTLMQARELFRMLRSTPSALVFGRPMPERQLPARPGGHE